jgi:hypothetical protein
MKRGRRTLDDIVSSGEPDLAGLMCEWQPLEARNGEIISLILVPQNHHRSSNFDALATQILELAYAKDEPISSPQEAEVGPNLQVQSPSPMVSVPSTAGGLELSSYLAWDFFKESDFRKFSDGLKITADLDTDRSSNSWRKRRSSV